MKASQYSTGLNISGKKMFETLRVKHHLKEDKHLIILRAASEAWETMLSTREDINNPDFNGDKPYALNKSSRGQLVRAMEKIWYEMR